MKAVTQASQFPEVEHLAVLTFLTKGTREFGGTHCSYLVFENEEDLKAYIISHPDTQMRVIKASPKNVSVSVKID